MAYNGIHQHRASFDVIVAWRGMAGLSGIRRRGDGVKANGGEASGGVGERQGRRRRLSPQKEKGVINIISQHYALGLISGKYQRGGWWHRCNIASSLRKSRQRPLLSSASRGTQATADGGGNRGEMASAAHRRNGVNGDVGVASWENGRRA